MKIDNTIIIIALELQNRNWVFIKHYATVNG